MCRVCTTFDDTYDDDGDYVDKYDGRSCATGRGGRYIGKKLWKADILAFLKLLATYQYRKIEFRHYRQHYCYWYMSQILAHKKL